MVGLVEVFPVLVAPSRALAEVVLMAELLPAEMWSVAELLSGAELLIELEFPWAEQENLLGPTSAPDLLALALAG